MKKLIQAVCMAGALATVACGDPIVGDWEGEFEDDGTTLEVDVTLESDGTGDMTLSAEENGVSIEVEYDLDWEKKSKGEYDLDAECTDVTVTPALVPADCEDFEAGELKCSLNDAKDKMTCEDEDDEPIVLEAK